MDSTSFFADWNGPRLAKLFLIGLVLAVGGFFLLQWLSRANPSAATKAVVKSIAVLPFESMSGADDNRSLADGMQDDVLNALAKVADLKVIARTSVMGYNPEVRRDLRVIGRALGVAYVLEGSVRRAGNHVRITTQLSDTLTNSQVWAERYDRDLSEIFAIKGDIAKRITRELEARLTPSEKSAIEKRPTNDLEAFDLYNRARTLRLTASLGAAFSERIVQVVDLLDRAVARDPAFLLAWCELAGAHDLLYITNYDHSNERLLRADTAAQAALNLQPDAGPARLALAQHLYQGYRDYERARRELDIARRTLPNSAEILLLTGYIDRRQGRWEDSVRHLEQAAELDPLNWFTLGQVASTYQAVRNYERAAEYLERAAKIRPNDSLTQIARAWLDYEWKADLQPLHATIDRILAEDPKAAPTIAADWLFLALCERDFTAAERALAALQSDEAITIGSALLNRAFGRGLVARERGDAEGARAAFQQARLQQEKLVQEQPNFALPLCVLGLIDAGLGDKDAALREGHKAVELLSVERDSLSGPDVLVICSIICAWTGQKDEALQYLENAAHKPSMITYGQLKKHPWWEPLRGDPRFEKIVAELAPR